MSLLSICTDALDQIGGVEVPGSFYGNSNPTAKQALKLVQQEGKSLEKEYRWAALITSTTITTVASTATYALATYAPGYRAFAVNSQWDRTNFRRLTGPASGADWQYRKSGLITSSVNNRAFRVQGSNIAIDPTPSSADTLAFDYYDKRWITKQADSSYVTEFTSDNDTCRLDEDLLTMGLKWRFLQAKGFPFEAEYKEYEQVKSSLQDDDGGKSTICLGIPSVRYDPLPDSGYGS